VIDGATAMAMTIVHHWLGEALRREARAAFEAAPV
jgi:hypothetical protein